MIIKINISSKHLWTHFFQFSQLKDKVTLWAYKARNFYKAKYLKPKLIYCRKKMLECFLARVTVIITHHCVKLTEECSATKNLIKKTGRRKRFQLSWFITVAVIPFKWIKLFFQIRSNVRATINMYLYIFWLTGII